VLVTLLEMAFAGHCGLEIDLKSAADPVAACFTEELGAVLQVAAVRVDEAVEVLERHGLRQLTHDLGAPTAGDAVTVAANGAGGLFRVAFRVAPPLERSIVPDAGAAR